MKFRVVLNASVCAASLFLAACGGGGVSSTPPPTSGGGNGGGGSPTPTPTPPSTGANDDLLGTLSSETFANTASRGTLRVNGDIESVTNATDVEATISYNAQNKSYSLTTPTGSITFSPADIDQVQSSDTATVFTKNSGGRTDTLTLTKPGRSGAATFQYVGSAFWQRTNIGSTSGSGSLDAIVYGVPTPGADVPRSGQASYDVSLLGATTIGPNISPLAGFGTASVDFDSGKVIVLGTLTLAPFQNSTSVFSADGKLSSASNNFSGSFTLNDFGHFTGTMSGQLFGPGAQEIGASWSANNGSRVATGTIMGRAAAESANSHFDGSLLGGLAKSQNFTAKEEVLRYNFKNTTSTGGGTFSNIGSTSEVLSIRFDADSLLYFLSGNDVSELYHLGSGWFLTSGGTKSIDWNAISGAGRYVRGYSLRVFDQDINPDYRASFAVYGFKTDAASMPTTGSAGYLLTFDGAAADPNYTTTVKINGDGLLRADFATGTLGLSGRLDFKEEIDISGVPIYRGTGSISGSGQIASGSQDFSGALAFDGLGNYSGTFNGAFYGPSAVEAGATFVASDNNGTAAGTFVGVKDAAVSAGTVPLAELTGKADLVGNRQDGVYHDRVTIKYNADTNAYSIPFRGVYEDNRVIAGNNKIDASRSDATRTYYRRVADGGLDGYIWNFGPDNPEFSLTYSTFAVISPITMPINGTTFQTGNPEYFVFGLATPSGALPRTGTGSFSGIIVGQGDFAQAGYRGAVGGTSKFVADFLSRTYSAELNFVTADGANIAGGTFDATGQIASNGFFGDIDGEFFGPNAEEFGGTFSLLRDDAYGRTKVEGLTIGKRD